MIKNLQLTILIMLISVNCSLAQDILPDINDDKIKQAIECLEGTDGEWAISAISGNNDTNKPIKIEFKNLKDIAPNFETDDALGWRDGKGKLKIFINERHKNSPYQALAALLSHESLHQDLKNSIQEETYAWTYEAEVWHQLKEKFPELKNFIKGQDSLVDRENFIENLFIQGNYSSIIIEQKIRNHPSYKNLPENSPGFGN